MSDADFWNEAWAADSVPRCSPHDPTLQMHWPSLGVRAGSRVLVPLSGKSADLTWLAANGYEPVGVDIAAAPCKQYFADRGVVPSLDRAGRFVRWRGAGVTILQGDIFDLDGSYEAPPSTAARSSPSLRATARATPTP
ncbi:hypothetical protein H7I76_00230 [Mycolicibacterium vaccae]|nr:hypothetical protein [Mycolicibacterium vaccae]